MSDNFFSKISGNNVMTYEGAMQKIGILLGFTVISALFTSAYSLTALEMAMLNYCLHWQWVA